MNNSLQKGAASSASPFGAGDGGNSAVEVLPVGTIKINSLVGEAISQLVEELRAHGAMRGIRTGFKKLDATVGGLRPGTLNLLASLPSAGKSTMLLNMLEEICLNQRVPSLFFCGDMQPLDVVKRFIFERSLLPLESIRTQEHMPSKCDLTRIKQCAADLAGSGLIINERRDLTLDFITATARKLHGSHGLGFIAIDHLHLIQPGHPDASAENMHGSAAVGLKSLARELGLPILATAHLRIEAHGRPADLRDLEDGTALAHEADFIGLLELKGEESGSDHVVLKILKNHGGRCGEFDLYRHHRLLRFSEYPPLTEEEAGMGAV